MRYRQDNLAYDLDLAVGSVSQLEQHVSEALSAPVEEARDYVRQQAACTSMRPAGAKRAKKDETGWREAREKAWLWTVATDLVTVFAIRSRRDSEVARELLGDDTTAMVGSDRHTAYGYLPVWQRQACWSPSRTAIQHVLTTVGQCAEDGAQQLELALQGAAPLDAEGDTLVVSWDGVTVPLREPAPKRGRPAERPMATATDPAPTAWKEAGVGMVATYLTPLDPEVEEPERVDVRYAARMPEAKMTTLVNGLVEQTARALQQGGYDHRVVLADGKREIWRLVDEHGVFEGFTRILDFYHAAQHLSMAAEHLFGKASATADRWYRSWRHKLRHTPNAVAGLIRSLSYHRRKLRRRSERYRQATTEMGYFRNNRDKMEYADYHASGLIISSGPVEAAAKTIVGHRLKRNGMRWTRHGGQQILNLRVQGQSKRWDAFWNWYLQQTTPITTLKRAA